MNAAAASLVDAFRETARRHPDRTALADASQELTYAALSRRAAAVAAALRARGVEPGAMVGLLLDRSADIGVAILGTLLAGATYVPLDPEYPDARLAYVVEDAGIDVVLASSSRLAHPVLAGRTVVDLGALPHGDGEQAAAGQAGPEDPAYVIYTSGSTGRPKGVLVSHRNVLSLLRATGGLFDFGPDDRWSLFHSYNFDFSVWELWGAWTRGAACVVVPADVTRSPPAFARFVADRGITVLSQVPSIFRHLAAQVRESGAPPPALRYVFFGGESVDLPSVASFRALYARGAPTFVNMYGITETTVHVTWKVLHDADLTGTASPIGRALPHLRIALVDADGRPVPAGEVGEMWVAGDGVASGYLGRPDLTADRFVDADLGGGPSRYYRSGDLARETGGGELEFVGRADAQVKLRGFRIELGEIETVLKRTSLVSDATVTVVWTAPGEGQLVAVVVMPDRTTPVPVAALRAALRAELPAHMVPGRFIRADGLPAMPSGKVNREAVASMAAGLLTPAGR